MAPPFETPIAADGDYDAFAVFDSVPGIVKSLDVTESKFMSILTAFIGVGSAFMGAAHHDCTASLEP